MTVVSLLKYHGLGNDFLISLHPAGLPGGDELDAEFVTTVCNRHRGVGADGVIVARPPALQSAGGSDANWNDDSTGGRPPGEGTVAPPTVRMELRNADGGLAETSGNGLACLALALVDSGMAVSRTVVIETLAGNRTVSVGPRAGACSDVRAEMGRLRITPQPVDAALGERWASFSVEAGNPHLVLVATTLEGIDVAGLGRQLAVGRPGGQNVEFVAPGTGGGLDLVTFERGAGLTEACGSGSCAAAAVARALGMVKDRVQVRNPGGTVLVDLSGEDPFEPAAMLSGLTCRVARVELELEPRAATSEIPGG
jgi:diaminopimelate epimerase